jgi:hypothetical protein
VLVDCDPNAKWVDHLIGAATPEARHRADEPDDPVAVPEPDPDDPVDPVDARPRTEGSPVPAVHT